MDYWNGVTCRDLLLDRSWLDRFPGSVPWIEAVSLGFLIWSPANVYSINLHAMSAAVICLTQFSAFSADWPQFRGGAGNGVVTELRHPTTWGETENVAWSIELPGGGWSSPIVVGDRVFVTMAISAAGTKPVGMTAGVRNMQSMGLGGTKPKEPFQFAVACLNLSDGTMVWQKTLDEKVPPFPVHPSNSFATESPASDGDRVFVYFGAIGLVAALDLEGNELWRKDVGAFKTGNDFGSGSSLALDEGRVFLQYDNDEKSQLIAFDASTGNELWKKERPYKTAWSTPLVWKNSTRTELVVCGEGNVTGYELTTGNELWKLTDIPSSFSASPTADQDRVFFGNSGPFSSGPLVAVKAGNSGETKLIPEKDTPGVAWSKLKSGPGMASPVISSGCLYVPGSGSILNCYDTATGDRVYRDRLPNAATVASSLWASNEYVFILDEGGTCFVVKAGKTFEVVATNKINDLFWSTPSVSGDSLLLRGVNKLYCIRAQNK